MSLVIAILALVVSIASALYSRKQAQHAAAIVDLERARDTAATQAALYANLTARMEGRDLRITNHGPAVARDVMVTLNGLPLAGNPVVYAGNNTAFPVAELAPTAMVDLRLSPYGPAGKAALTVRVTWHDDSQAEARVWGSVLSWP